MKTLRSAIFAGLLFGLAASAAVVLAKDQIPIPQLSGFQQKETPLFLAKLDASGNMVSFVVKQFADELLHGRFLPKDESLEKLGGLILGPVAGVQAQAKAETKRTTDGGFWMHDPTGTWLPKELEAERRYQFSETTYATDIEVTLRNKTDRTIPLSTPSGDVCFWLGPILGFGTNQAQETIVSPGDGTVEVLSPKATLQTAPAGSKWIGARESYFCATLQEKKGRGSYVYRLVDFEEPKGTPRQGLLLGFRYQYPELRSHEVVNLSFRLYLGPKLEKDLQTAGYTQVFDNWNGFTGGIGKLMFHMLQLFHTLTGSYGIAILLLTLLVKILLHPLNLKQLRSMAKMQVLQPKMAELKKKYPEPREFQTKMQELYIEHEVNPLGGCFPILLQIPIFIALYSCLMGAIELKKVTFLWLPDLAKPDPIALLPILFAGSIYVSSKLTSQTAPIDPTQKTMMQIMPIMMLMFMVNVPAGVMLYLAGQSILSLFETKWNQAIMKQEEDQKKARKADRQKKRSKKESHEAEESVS